MESLSKVLTVRWYLGITQLQLTLSIFCGFTQSVNYICFMSNRKIPHINLWKHSRNKIEIQLKQFPKLLCHMKQRGDTAIILPYRAQVTGHLTDMRPLQCFCLHNNLANINMFLILSPGDKRVLLRDCKRPSGGRDHHTSSVLWKCQ